ncbi:MAG: glucose-6-phosphate isomerase, partial [Proteobacteria bacterium]|nr:glucose-6-phosphate isomerase [Pseudomonadota bacterium]
MSQSVTMLPAWRALEAHFQQIRDRHLRELFAEDPQRGERFHIEAVDVYLDYSKNRITADTIGLLVELAEACGLRRRIEAMFRGDAINVSEQRAALHVALRAPRDTAIIVGGNNVVADVHAVLDRMERFCEQVRSGAWQGHT